MKTKELWKLLRGYDRAWSNPACKNLPRLTKDGYLHYREVFQTRMMKALLEETKRRLANMRKSCSRIGAPYEDIPGKADCRELMDNKGNCPEWQCKYHIGDKKVVCEVCCDPAACPQDCAYAGFSHGFPGKKGVVV